MDNRKDTLIQPPSTVGEPTEFSVDGPSPDAGYTLYPYRWLLQACFSLAMASAQLLMFGFSPIAQIISVVFDCSPGIVEAQSLIFLGAFVPANFVAINVLPRKGLAFTLRAGAILCLVGGWLRLLVNVTEKFEYACVGSVFAAFG